MRYTEGELVIPALEILQENPQGVDMSFLITELTLRLSPEGKDVEILTGRNDTYFSQKVRNLKSHDTLTRKGLATYSEGVFKITSEGKFYLTKGFDQIASALQEQGFEEKDREEEFENDYEGIVIEEGAAVIKNVQVRKRSKKLTEIAKKYFTSDGKIPCITCEFNFYTTYGDLGKGYIEIHHTHPMHEHDIEGEKEDFKEVIKKLAPLCSNCHRMIHRNPGTVLSLDNLKKILKDNKSEL